MSIEILEFVETPIGTPQKPGWKRLGMLKVLVGKMELWLEVMESKDGNPWFRIPNIKAGEKWMPAYYFQEKAEFGKWATEELKNVFKNKYM